MPPMQTLTHGQLLHMTIKAIQKLVGAKQNQPQRTFQGNPFVVVVRFTA